MGICEVIIGKKVSAEEQLDRFFDDIQRNAAVDLLQLLTGLFIGLVIHGLRRLEPFTCRNFIGRSHPFRMIQGVPDVAKPLFLGTVLKVDGNMSWRDIDWSVGLV